MSGLYELEPGFGDRNTFTQALLGVRSLLDLLAVVVQGPTGRRPGTGGDGPPPEPDRFEALVLGLLAVKDLLDELAPPPDQPESGAGSSTGDPGPGPEPDSDAGWLR